MTRVCLETFACNLRENPTKSEVVLLTAIQQKGYCVVFNEPLHGYIPDFYFPNFNKIVELDGKQFHDLAKDRKRDAHFKTHGIRTFRICSHRVFTELSKVMRSIEVFLGTQQPKPKKKKAKKLKKPKSTPAWARVPKVKEARGLRYVR